MTQRRQVSGTTMGRDNRAHKQTRDLPSRHHCALYHCCQNLSTIMFSTYLFYNSCTGQLNSFLTKHFGYNRPHKQTLEYAPTLCTSIMISSRLFQLSELVEILSDNFYIHLYILKIFIIGSLLVWMIHMCMQYLLLTDILLVTQLLYND